MVLGALGLLFGYLYIFMLNCTGMERHSPGVVQDTRNGTAVLRDPPAVRSERVRGSRVRVLPGRQGELRGRQDLQGWRQGW